jgi:uncharacterized repeat protein (TIGR01451 family)
VRLRLQGASSEPRFEGEELLPGETNYFIGNDPSKWVRHVPAYARVRARGVYAGVDVVYYSRGGQLEYDFVVAPGADPRAIAVQVEGGDRVKLDEEGALVIETKAGALRQAPPAVYQETAGGRRAVTSRYVELGGGAVGFELGAYDESAPLVIDPVIVFFEDDNWYGRALAVDGEGNSYVLTMIEFEAHDSARVVKRDERGALVFAFIFGGTSDEVPTGMSVDGLGNVWVCGATNSHDFPMTSNAIQASKAGFDDGFIVKLSAAGDELLYATYLGGEEGDIARELVLDPAGDVYLVGETESSSFLGDQTPQGSADAFVVKMSASGDLGYVTRLGGSGEDVGRAVAIDPQGGVVLGGLTRSSDFPVRSPLQAEHGGGTDGFVARVDPSGEVVISTFLGGSGDEQVNALGVDDTGNAYAVGWTTSQDFPVVDALQPAFAGGDSDAFVAKMSATGTTLVYSTYLGGDQMDIAAGIDVEGSGVVYVAGGAESADFPIHQPIPDQEGPAPFLTKLAADGSALVYSTFLPGGWEYSIGVSAYGSGFVYVGLDDGSVLKIDERNADLSVRMSDSPDPIRRTGVVTYTITVTNTGPDMATNVVVATAVPSATMFVSRSATQGLVSAPPPGGSGGVGWRVGTLKSGRTATLTLKVRVKASAPLGALTNEAVVASDIFDPDASDNTAQVATTVW